MYKVLQVRWYLPFTTRLDKVGIVKTECNGEIFFHIGTAEGKNEKEDIKNIITYGDFFHPEVFER